MFRPIPAITRFTSERVLVFIRFMRFFFNDGVISQLAGMPHRTAATKIGNYASIAPQISTIPTLVVIIKTTDDHRYITA